MKPPPWVRYYEKLERVGSGDFLCGKPRAELMKPVHNNESTAVTVKPSGGLWTSPVDAEYGWETWCRDTGHDKWLGRRWDLRVKGTPTLAVVDSRAHLNDLAVRYPLSVSYGGTYVHRSIDFEKLAQDVDGLWVTTQGHFATRLLDVGEPNTYAWDCETVLWFRWRFDRVKKVSP